MNDDDDDVVCGPAIAMKQQAVPATAMSPSSMRMPGDWQVSKQAISYKYS